MEAVFSKILDMSLTASYVIATILLIRLLLKKAPKKYSYALWAVAAFRLICPASIESAFSLFNLNFSLGTQPSVTLQAVPEHNVSDYIAPLAPTGTLSPDIAPSAMPAATPLISGNLPTASVITEAPEPALTLMGILAVIWCVGIAALLTYSAAAYIKLKRQMFTAVLLEGNIRQAEGIRSPFILGFIRPQIYIPYHLNESELSYVLAHERYHLKRKDHIVKPLAFLILVMHWFNPLVWLAFHLMTRDMEMSCDEKVLSRDESIRKAYSSTLLSFAAGRSFPAPSPLSFGEGSVKSRIKNVLHWKKPALWISTAAIIICIAVIIVCATNPRVLISADEVENVYMEGQMLSSEAETELIALINSHSKSSYRSAPDSVGFADSRAVINCTDGSSYTIHYWYCSGFSFNPAHFGEDDYYSILTRINADGEAEKSWKMEYAFDKEFLSWMDVHSVANIFPFDESYQKKEELFSTPSLSFVFPLDTAERISLEKGGGLYIDGEPHGSFQMTSLTENNWDDLFSTSGVWQNGSAKQLRRNNFRVWRAVNGSELLYLLVQENGSVYIAEGFYDSEGERDPYSDDSSISRVYRLQSDSFESVRWQYYAAHPTIPDYFPIAFDMDYSSIELECTGGVIRYLDANGYLCYNPKVTITERDTNLGWWPTSAIDMSVISSNEVFSGRGSSGAELSFTVTLKDGGTLSGTIRFTNPNPDNLDIYEATIDAEGIRLCEADDGIGAVIYAESEYSTIVPEVRPGRAVWERMPTSSSRAPWFEFEFDLDYSKLQISTTSGSLSSDGSQLDGMEQILDAGYTVRWSPYTRFQISSGTQLQFTLTLTDGSLVQGTVYITSEDNLYTAELRANGLYLSNDEDYGHAVITATDSLSGTLPPEASDDPVYFTTDLNELLNQWQSKGVTELSEDQLARINMNFQPGYIYSDELNPLSCFFQCYYDRPEDINLAAFLQYNFTLSEGYTEADFIALKQQYGSYGQLSAADTYEDAMKYHHPIHKFPREKVDAQLMKYAGVTTADISFVNTVDTGMVYLESSDAYFNFTSDMGSGSYTSDRGRIDGDTVYLYSGFATLTLKKSGDAWLIYSHTYNSEAATIANLAAGILEIFDIGGEMNITLHTANTGAHETITVTDRAVAEQISYIIQEHSYTRLEMPYTEPSAYWITVTPSMPTNKMTFWSGNTQMLQYSPRGDHCYYDVSVEGVGSLAWAVRRVYENLLLDHGRIEGFVADTAEAAAAKFAESVYGEHLMTVPGGGVYSIEHYRLIEQEVLEASADGGSVLGRFVLAVWPEDLQSSGFWAGNGRMGDGDYYGWILSTYEFVLERGEDGLWHCTGLGTGGYSLD